MPSFTLIFSVMLGGALGALGRYLTSIGIGGLLAESRLEAYPVATFGVNILGSFLLALLFFSNHELPPAVRTALGVGFLGALTTFSTFGLETFYFIDEGRWLAALSYSLGSLGFGLGAIGLGRWVALSF